MDIRELCINEDSSIIDSMKQLDKAGKRILFVLRDNALVATLTDGDIRRWILKKGDLEAKVRSVANYRPKYLHEKEKMQARNLMEKQKIEALPIVNEKMEIVSIVFSSRKSLERAHHLNIPVVIMAGGFGTRLYPYTKILPKPLIPIGEYPIAEHIMDRFHLFGVDEFYLVVNHKKNMIKAYFNELEKTYTVSYADEDTPLGTAGGLSLLKEKILSTFILSNCDILIEEDYEKIVNFHRKENNFITMVCSLKNIRIPYGIVEISETGEIEKLKEKPVFSFFTNTGVYVAEPDVIAEMREGTRVDFPELIQAYKEKGKKIGIYPISEDSWMDMGNPEGMEAMKKKLERAETDA